MDHDRHHVEPGSAPRSTSAPDILFDEVTEAARLRSLLAKIADAHFEDNHAECDRLLRAFRGRQ